MHSRHGEQLPNGFKVGDLVSYGSGTGPVYGMVVPHPPNRDEMAGEVWALWARRGQDQEAALSPYRNTPDERPSWMGASNVTLVRSVLQINEGSTTMSEETFDVRGEQVPVSMRPSLLVEGREYRVIYPQDEHQFEFIGVAQESGTTLDRPRRFTITAWVREASGSFNERNYPIGSDWTASISHQSIARPQCVVLELASAASTDSNYAGDPGEFVAHDGQMPEAGTVVRAFNASTGTRQIEGLFLRTDGTGAVVERKRRRSKRADGTFGPWEAYSSGGRVEVRVEGATIFKAGAGGTPTLVRGTPITDGDTQRAIKPGDILSARSATRHNHVYRGTVVSRTTDGEVVLQATEMATLSDPYTVDSNAYVWEAREPSEVEVHCTWSEGRDGYARGAYLWTLAGPDAPKRVDPAFDPNRKTTHTGLKIGDLVVGVVAEARGGRDSVASWVKGEIFKWDTRYNRPFVKVTDAMESDKKVDAEVKLESDDVYPAMADPSAVSPEEYKKTLRLYLIGRHKRGDFCRGGLNTMLAAHGIPLYETRRRAQLVVTVDYDPNVTDLYSVQTDLRSRMTGVSGLSFSERTGEDIELTLESDRTNG